MKKLHINFLFTLLLGILSFPFTASAGAISTQQNFTFDFNRVIFIPAPCANEDVRLTGDLHVLIESVINGKQLTLKTHFQPQGITGVGLTYNDSFQGVGMTGETTITFNNVTFPFVTTVEDIFDIIGHGPAPNSREHDLTHVTINANGDITAYNDSSRIVCETGPAQ